MIDKLQEGRPLTDQFDDAVTQLLDDPRWSELRAFEVIGLLERQAFIFKARMCGYRQVEIQPESP